MDISSLVLQKDETAEGRLFVFKKIKENYSELLNLYENSSFRFFEEGKFILNSISFSISQDPQEIDRFIQTGKFSLNYSIPDGALENEGCSAKKVFSEDMLLAFAAGVDVKETYMFVNPDFILKKERDLSTALAIMRGMDSAAQITQYGRTLLGSTSSECIDDSFEKRVYPELIQGHSLESKSYLLSKLLRSVSDEKRTAVFHHLLLYTGCLLLKARSELYSFFDKNKLLVKRIIDANKFCDAFNRISYNVLARDLGRNAKLSRCRYDGYIFDLVLLAAESGASSELEFSGVDFERMCMEELLTLGFDAYLTKPTGDFGADIIAEKDGLTYCIQCKYLSRPVGVKAVQEVAGAQRHYLSDFSVIISITPPTLPARELATSTNVTIIDFSNLSSIEDLVLRLNSSR